MARSNTFPEKCTSLFGPPKHPHFLTPKPQDCTNKTAGNEPLKVSMFRGSVLARSLPRKSIRPENITVNINPLQSPLPILMGLDNGMPEPKSLHLDALEGKISLLLAHALVKDGALIPM